MLLMKAVGRAVADPNLPLYVAALIGAAGAVIAAAIGVFGIRSVLRAEQRERQAARFVDSLAGIMRAVGNYSVEMNAWMDVSQGPYSRRNFAKVTAGGPVDAGVQTAIDIATMTARTDEERSALFAIRQATNALKRGYMGSRLSALGQITGDIRGWQQGTMPHARLIQDMTELVKTAATEEAKMAATATSSSGD
jgi:hypothetical protein